MSGDFSSQEGDVGAAHGVSGTPVEPNGDLTSSPESPSENISSSGQPSVPPPMPVPPPPAPHIPATPRAPVQLQPAEQGWWLASDGQWYPPESSQGASTSSSPSIVSPSQGSQNIVIQMAHPGPGQYLGPPKSKATAAVLAFFFGTLGVHRFYLGRAGSGAAMLILSLTLFGLVITLVWELVDFILILTGNLRGPDGRPLT
jgi:TM2 domain-containing membrane protein YozV